MIDVELSDVREEHLAPLARMMTDRASILLAAFGRPDDDAAAIEARWRSAVGHGVRKVILVRGEVAGFVATFDRDGATEVTYWIERAKWGSGLATFALSELLRLVTVRPIHASAWVGNVGSQRVLEKCGFVRTREGRAFAEGRGEEVSEVFFVLG